MFYTLCDIHTKRTEATVFLTGSFSSFLQINAWDGKADNLDLGVLFRLWPLCRNLLEAGADLGFPPVQCWYSK